jgi:hypothetical protein
MLPDLVTVFQGIDGLKTAPPTGRLLHYGTGRHAGGDAPVVSVRDEDQLLPRCRFDETKEK